MAPAQRVKPLADVKVAVFSAQEYVRKFLELPLLEACPDSKFIEVPLDTKSAALAEGCDVACLFVNDTASTEVIEALAQRGVRLLAMRCAGFDRVDLDAAAAAGVAVVRVPTYSPRSIAEHALTLALCLNRNIHLTYNRVREGNYTLSGLIGYEMHGKTVGIVGTGAIGAAACRIFQGVGCRVVAHDVRQNPELAAAGVQYMALEDLLACAHLVSLHCPLMPSTFHILDARRLALMQPQAVLVNTSRGGLVDTDALLDALESGHLGGVAMDVYEREGNLFFNDYTRFASSERWRHWDRKFAALKDFPNVLITPHSAFLTHEALANIASTTVANIAEWAAGQPLTNQVSKC